MAPSILGTPKKDRNFDNHPYRSARSQSGSKGWSRAPWVGLGPLRAGTAGGLEGHGGRGSPVGLQVDQGRWAARGYCAVVI